MFVYTTGYLFNVPLTGTLLNRAQIRTKTGCSNYSSQLPMFSSAIPISLPAVTPFHSDLQVFLGFFYLPTMNSKTFRLLLRAISSNCVLSISQSVII